MYDPWVTREFTITDLMAQRSGLPDRCGDDLVTLGYNRLQLMHSARYLKPATSFRSTYAYQNMPFLWAAAVVENLTNESWEENIHDRIFQPLGMANSSTDMQSFRKAKDVVTCTMRGEAPSLLCPWTGSTWISPTPSGPRAALACGARTR